MELTIDQQKLIDSLQHEINTLNLKIKELHNSGKWNSGKRNSGNWNSGNYNSGNYNSGYYNSGYCNSGYWNSGNWNSGSHNSGNWNSGYWNSGKWNSGDYNSGNYNSGYWNSGNYNSGNYNSGYFNTKTPQFIKVFNKKCLKEIWDKANQPKWLYNIILNKWIEIDEMTDQEKIDNPKYQITRGYLKNITYYEAAKIAWDNTTEEDRLLTLKLPNFNKKVFFKIFGIDVSDLINKEGN